MKDKILVFIIGLLVGAIITEAGFLIYERTNNNNQAFNENGMRMMQRPEGGTPPEMPNNSDGNRPELPQNNNFTTNNKTNNGGNL